VLREQTMRDLQYVQSDRTEDPHTWSQVTCVFFNIKTEKVFVNMLAPSKFKKIFPVEYSSEVTGSSTFLYIELLLETFLKNMAYDQNDKLKRKFSVLI